MDDNTTSLRMAFFIKQFAAANLFVVLFFPISGSTDVIAQGNDIDTAREYIKQGNSFYDKDDYENSILYYNKADAIAKILKDDALMYSVYIRKGLTYLLSAENQKSLDAYYNALAITQKMKDLDKEVIANSGIILVLKRMNQLDKAHKIASQMLKSIDKTSFKNKHNHVNILATSSDIYLAREQYDSVLSFAEKGITISKLLDYKEGLVDFYIKKGMIFYYKKKYDKSLTYLLDAQRILHNHDIKNKFYPTVNTNYFLASCYYEQGLYDKAIDQLHKTTKTLEEKDLIKPPVIQSHLLLANCYGAKKDFENALHWNNKYVRLTKNYQKDKDATVNKIYEKEAEKLEGEIVHLKNKHAASEKLKQYIFGGFIILALILIGFVYRYFNKQKSNKKVFQDLMHKIDRLEAHEHDSLNREMTKQIIIDDTKVNEILKGLDKLEEREYFLRSDCNLRAIAKKTKTNATYLSKIINIHKEKNFNDYINDLRIDYVLKRLKSDKKFRSFSIKSIATEIGYKSDYSFSKHFKAKTGLNPSYYIKKLEKQEISLDQVS